MKSIYKIILFFVLPILIVGCSKTDIFPTETAVQGALKGNWQKNTDQETEGYWEKWNFNGNKALTVTSNLAVSNVHIKEVKEKGFFTVTLNYTIETSIVSKNKLTIIGDITGRNYGHTWKITTLDDDVLALTSDSGPKVLIELSKIK